MPAGHQQLHSLRFQQRVCHVHPVGHGNDIGMLAQHAGNFKGCGAGVQNNAMTRLHQFSRRLRDAALHSRIKGTFVLNGRLHAGGITFTNQRAAVSANGNPLLFQKGQIVTDRHRRHAV